jgi:protein SCO1
MRTGNRQAAARATGAGVWAAGWLLASVLTVSPAQAQLSRPLSVPPPGKAATERIPILKEVGIDQKLDAQIPLDLEFSNEQGQPVKLRQFFGTRPVVMALVYYECPMLCTQVLNGFAGSLQGMSFTVGQEYDVLVVSFDPGETPAMAAERKHEFVRRYIRDAREANIHFLTGRESAIKALTDAVGFKYAYDAAIDQYAHPAAITVLTPQGHVSRYLYGVEFAPRDLKLAIVEASAGRVGTFVEQALLFCYHYDPETGKYGLVILNFVRAAGALTVLLMVGWIVLSLRRERRQAHAVSNTATTGTR